MEPGRRASGSVLTDGVLKHVGVSLSEMRVKD